MIPNLIVRLFFKNAIKLNSSDFCSSFLLMQNQMFHEEIIILLCFILNFIYLNYFSFFCNKFCDKRHCIWENFEFVISETVHYPTIVMALCMSSWSLLLMSFNFSVLKIHNKMLNIYEFVLIWQLTINNSKKRKQ